MESLFYLFLIAAIGLLIGTISIKGIQLGTCMCLVIALIFGHFGIVLPPLIKDIGLVLFVTSVGLIAGPIFFQNFKEKAFQYVMLGALTIALGAVSLFFLVNLLNIPKTLAVGLFAGALTSTPGLAAALEITNDPTVSVGYGVTYLFGVIGVVLFIQLLPKLLKVDLVKEGEKLSKKLSKEKMKINLPRNIISVDESGLFVFSLTVVIGLILGKIKVPLPGNNTFQLGLTGGPLFAGIIIGAFQKVGRLSLAVRSDLLESLQELGLILFLISTGTDAGGGFLNIIREYGVLLFLVGAIVTLVPMIGSTLIALKFMKLDLLNTLGSVCGGMTSTPALGTLIKSSKSKDVIVAYAATYPIALILVVVCSKILVLIL